MLYVAHFTQGMNGEVDIRGEVLRLRKTTEEPSTSCVVILQEVWVAKTEKQ